MKTLLFFLIQSALVFTFAPLLIGLIRTCKARFQNRRGASVFQPYWALATLCRKEMTVTKHSSWVFRVVPFVVLTSAILFAFLVPIWGWSNGLFGGGGSIFLIAGVLAMGSLFLVLGGMDVASAFGGMGSSREMTIAALVEPALLIVLVTLGFAAKAWQVQWILMAFAQHPWYLSQPFLLVTFLALWLIVLAENARYPVDNPATHLELTMVHEAMILEYSGPYLAMLEYASALKLTVLSVLAMNLFLPFGLFPAATVAGIGVAILGFVFKLVLSGFLVALVESTVVKMRFYRMQEYLATAYLLGCVGLALLLTASYV